ncbi:type II toxin-antitoxin system HipA family toxin [Emticicia sp. CRIBPO]|uniref:type II toxin-antitoxin system HipA family toxin n=1 Tax=Emticicia sp. CRIBPO TaxID=2683258 RepID=UPI0014132852|nr:type II toxin-antitoxin system HipA family toxin [Emticicia sp. CRIBPO]NBA89201.1 type II toxin-antitoxin system HipA family toxin [Emticicia sp. CRIBPO]
MAGNKIIDLYCFEREIGKIGYDEDQKKSFFQYHPAFLKEGLYQNIFPLIFKRTAQTQVFSQFENETFRGLPPMIADSLPDMFGHIIFKTWLESNQKNSDKISVIEQLAYVANRGMGALSYQPAKHIPENATINLDEITDVLKKVLDNKRSVSADQLNSQSLLNIFKIGTSAGGARPKILISENKETAEIIPGDLEYSEKFNHYLVKLSLDDDLGYNREIIEYSYYLTAITLGISMMPSRLIDQKHFATLRFDRQNGKRKHILTATGMTGWDFKDPEFSRYENLFELAVYLKLPHRETDELFRRMIFNIVFCNTDDHLKNHSFIYDETSDKWNLSPAYDLTYSLNPLLNYKRTSRALSVNYKRADILLNDVLSIADKYTIKNARGIIEKTLNATDIWEQHAHELHIPGKIIESIKRDFNKLL